ncbi:MAG TPA: ABC transporter ATP-binding protein [bacterium]|nr:ABC transporter ATP-binding protein [bacterium]
MTDKKEIVQLTGISKIYRMGDTEVHALDSVSFSIYRGDFVAIMGASGSGKSTLMNIIGCLDKPTSGKYLLDGTGVSELSRNDLAEIRNRKLGFVFQNFNLLPRTSALENVELPMLYANVSGTGRRARAEEVLKQVGLSERMFHHSNQMSGGQQQRVAIARALVCRPKMVLADEPTGNLDSRSSIEIMALFQELGNSGITMVLVTHEPDIAAFCSRVVVMRDGKILTDTRQTPKKAEV